MLNDVPVTGCDRDDNGYLFTFGAYGDTRLVVLAGSLEDALEQAFEWLDEHAPGLLTKVDYEAAARELGPQASEDSIAVHAELDLTVCSHTTLEHGNAIPNWEWAVRDLEPAEVAEARARMEAE